MKHPGEDGYTFACGNDDYITCLMTRPNGVVYPNNGRGDTMYNVTDNHVRDYITYLMSQLKLCEKLREQEKLDVT
jgi:hypothetical protein